MKLTLPEAAEAAADLFTGNPESHVMQAYGVTEGGTAVYDDHLLDGANVARYCAVGAVAVAAGVSIREACEFLRPFASYLGCPESTNNKGRGHAIRMLRKAARQS